MSGSDKRWINMSEGLHALAQANRQSGSWLPNVEICTQQVMPCGNGYCLDEAMRSAQVTNKYPSEHALDHAHQIARRCRASVCPAELATGYDRHAIIDMLANT